MEQKGYKCILSVTFILLISTTPLTEAYPFDFCNYHVIFDNAKKYNIKLGEQMCSDVEDITIQSENKFTGISRDLFTIEVSSIDNYTSNERDSLIIAIKSASADPEIGSIVDNCTIGKYTGYYGMGSYYNPDFPNNNIFVFQFKLLIGSRSDFDKLVTLKSYLDGDETKNLLKTFVIEPKGI